MSDIEYARDFEFVHRPVARRLLFGILPGQNMQGYGNKITTDRCVRLPGSRRLYRVYATCHSNVSSLWITHRGKKLFINDCYAKETQCST